MTLPTDPKYATIDDFQSRLSQKALADLSADVAGADSDEDVLEALLHEVDGMIDTAANTAGYATPINSDVPATMSVLRTHELSIAKFLLLDRRGMTAYDPASETLYKAALDFLKALANGDVELAGASAKAVPMTPTGAVSASSEKNVFGRGFRECNPRRGI